MKRLTCSVENGFLGYRMGDKGGGVGDVAGGGEGVILETEQLVPTPRYRKRLPRNPADKAYINLMGSGEGLCRRRLIEGANKRPVNTCLSPDLNRAEGV